jgi:cellulose synthase/poly-beta-1,6-N-acetylglucosamine synthase-like glycosyltransferase
MWILTFLFLATTAIIGWTLFLFLIYNFIASLLKSRQETVLPAEWPEVTFIIPTYNEADQILDKLENTRALDYPADKLSVIIADGKSTDDTIKRLQDQLKADERISIEICPQGGKINQLNHVLNSVNTPIVVNSDADARLEPDALKWLVAEFQDEETWVAGAFCKPESGLKIEQYIWEGQNKNRLMESDARTASIVVAPCYGFRRELLTQFPDDVVADDIYVAFLANTIGKRTAYSRKAHCTEVRVPETLKDFLPQKFRKSNAYLRESLRFVYRLPEMDMYGKVMHVTRVVQQLLLPWMVLSWVLIAAALLTLNIGTNEPRYDLVIFGAATLFTLLILTSTAFALIEVPGGTQRFSIITVVNGYILLNLILIVTAISYPFFKQGSAYKRLAGATPAPVAPDTAS